MKFLNKSLYIYSQIFPHINKRRKWQIFLSIIISLIVTILESLGISSLFPFIASIIDPSKIYNIEIIKNILDRFNIGKENLVVFFGSVFIFLIALSAILKIFLLKINTKICYSLIAEICIVMFKKILKQPYHLHLNRNTSDVVATLALRSKSVGETTFFLISIINSILFTIFITLTVILIAPFNIVNLLAFFFIFYFVVFLIVKNKVKLNSLNISEQSGNLIKTIQESLGSIREILIYKSSNLFLPKFNSSNLKLRNAEGNQVFVSSSPSHVLQAIILVGAILFAYHLNSKGILIELIPVMSSVILAIQKLFPNIQTIFTSYTSVSGLEDSLRKTSEMLKDYEGENKIFETDKKHKPKLTFNNEIGFKNVCFSYSENDAFKLDNIQFSIKKGEKIGIKGPSGSGKSTIVDLLLGLLKPTSGKILFDSKQLDESNIETWQEKIAFVSQNIFLTDESISKNVSFSDEKQIISEDKINTVLKNVNLLNYINKLPDGINSKVGERGSNLSGGQIQRIGIARALFKNKEVIILDEATNSIDKNNEEIIIENLSKIDGLTLIIISHDDHLLKKCDQIFFVKDGKLQTKS